MGKGRLRSRGAGGNVVGGGGGAGVDGGGGDISEGGEGGRGRKEEGRVCIAEGQGCQVGHSAHLHSIQFDRSCQICCIASCQHVGMRAKTTGNTARPIWKMGPTGELPLTQVDSSAKVAATDRERPV